MDSQASGTGLSHRDAWIALVCGALAFAAYARTTAPGLLPSDSAEFQVLVHFQATAHTTGYSVYLLLAKLWSFLPLGEPALRVNLFSAWMGALAVGLTYLLGMVFSHSRYAGILSAIVLALSATFWSQAVIAEVYSTAAAFLAGVLLLAACWYRSRRAGYLFGAGVLGGLSLGVHGSVALAAPAVLALVVSSRPVWRRVLPAALGGAFLGLALMFAAFVYQDANRANYNIFETAYVPAASAWDRSAADLDSTWERFVFILSAEQWRPAMFADPLQVFPDNADRYFEALGRDFSWAVLLLPALGLVVLFTVDWRLALFLGLGYLVHMIYSLNYRIGDIYVFFVMAWVYRAAAMAAGYAALERWLRRLIPRLITPARSAGIWRIAFCVVFVTAACLPFASQRITALCDGEIWFDFAGMPRAAEAADWHAGIVQTVNALGKNTIVYLGWYDVYAYYYVAYIELGRDDLYFIEPTPYSRKGGIATSMLAFIRANQGKREQMFQYEIERLDQVGLYTRPRAVGPNRFFVLQPK